MSGGLGGISFPIFSPGFELFNILSALLAEEKIGVDLLNFVSAFNLSMG